MTGDPKHPARWEKNPGVLCRTANRGKYKKKDQEKVLRMSSWKFSKKRDDILGDTVMIRLQGAPLIYTLQMQGTNLFSLKRRPLSAAKSYHSMILSGNFMHSQKFACFPNLFSPCPLKLLCFCLNSTLRTCYSFCNSYTYVAMKLHPLSEVK